MGFLELGQAWGTLMTHNDAEFWWATNLFIGIYSEAFLLCCVVRVRDLIATHVEAHAAAVAAIQLLLLLLIV